GVHCGDLGTATVVLMPRSAEERRRQSGRGALVVGLGEMGALTAEGVTQAVRTGALRYLLLESDRAGEDGGKESPGEGQALPLRLASLLIGTNSSAQLDIEDAVRAVVLGVLRANRDFAAGAHARGASSVAVTCLEFIEVYRDAAISAAYAVA